MGDPYRYGLHDLCVSHAFLNKPERVCAACYDRAERASGLPDPNAHELAKWIAEQGVG